MKNRGKSREIMFNKQTFLQFFIEILLQNIEQSQKIRLNCY